MDQAQQDALKLEFAANLLRSNGEAHKAAFLTTHDTGLALQIAQKWPTDPVVIACQTQLLSDGEARTFLPTKEQQAMEIYKLATTDRADTEERLKAHRLYAEIMGYIEKPVPGAVQNILNQGVMIVRSAGSDEEWQEKATRQQRTLIADAATVN